MKTNWRQTTGDIHHLITTTTAVTTGVIVKLSASPHSDRSIVVMRCGSLLTTLCCGDPLSHASVRTFATARINQYRISSTQAQGMRASAHTLKNIARVMRRRQPTLDSNVPLASSCVSSYFFLLLRGACARSCVCVCAHTRCVILISICAFCSSWSAGYLK